mgnify:FL=1
MSSGSGPYKVQGPLAQGGMGAVVRAVGPDGVLVALKRAARDRASHHAALRREIDLLQRLDLPGVVRCLDAGSDAAGPWMALELLEGPTIASWAAAGRSVDELLAVGMSLAVTLAHLHAAGVVHGDLKPANVLMVPGRGPVLVDFGLASERATFRPRLSGGAVGGGTLAFQAPERVTGSDDARADLFALGRLLDEGLGCGRTGDLGALLDVLGQADPRHRPPHALFVARRLHELAGLPLPPLPTPRPHPPVTIGRDAVVQAIFDGVEARGGAVVEGLPGVGTTHVLRAVERRLAPGQRVAWSSLSGLAQAAWWGADRPPNRQPELLVAWLEGIDLDWLLLDRSPGPLDAAAEGLLARLTQQPPRGLRVVVVAEGGGDVRVPPLSERAMGELLESALGSAPEAHVRDSLVDAAAGRPGWLAAEVERAIEGGRLALDAAGAWRAVGQWPDVWARRTQALSVPERGLLAGLAAVGGPLPGALVRSLDAQVGVLGDLLRSGWLLQDGTDQVDFPTPRAQETALAWGPADLAELHRAVAEWLDLHQPHDKAGRADAWRRAGRHGIAAALYEEAAEDALARLDLGETERALRGVLSVVSPGGIRSLDARTTLAFKVLRIDGRAGEAETMLEQVVAETETAGLAARHGAALRRLGVLRCHRGVNSHGLATLDRARAVSLAAGEAREAAYALADRGATMRGGGRWTDAVDALTRAVGELQALEGPGTTRRERRNLAIYQCSLGGCLSLLGRQQEARHRLHEGVALLRRTADASDLAPALAQYARLLRHCGEAGDLDRSVQLSREAIRLAATAGDAQRQAQARVQLAETWMALGRLAEADQELAEARALVAGLGFLASEVYIHGRSGDLEWLRDRPERARAAYERALEICEATRLFVDGALCRIRIASCARRMGDRDTVAQQLAWVAGMLDEPGLPLATRVELWCEQGLADPSQAEARLAEAEAASEALQALEPHAEELLWTLREALELR